MSSAQTIPAQFPASENRRSHLRRKVDRLAYVHLDKDNGGILIDLSEGGLNFQGVAGVMEGELCRLKFIVPMSNHRIETAGQVVWSNSSRRGGGIRFVDLPEAMRQQIKNWIAGNSVSSGIPQEVTKEVEKQGTEDTAKDISQVLSAVTRPSEEHSEPLPSVAANLADIVMSERPSPELGDEGVAAAPDSQLAGSIDALPIIQSERELPALGKEPPAESFPNELTTSFTVAGIPVVASGPITAPSKPIPIEAKQHSAPASSSTQNYRPMFMPGESFSKPNLAKQQKLAEADKHPKHTVRVSQTGVIALVASFVALLAVLGFSQADRLATLFSQNTLVTSAGSQEPAHESAGVTNFEVEALDSNNRRWLLTNKQEIAPLTPNAPERAAVIPVLPARNRDIPPPPLRASSNLALRPPSSRNVQRAPASVEAPDLRVEASSAIMNDSRAIFVPPPELPAPSAPGAEAASRGPNFPRPILMRSVPPKYPLEAKMANVGGVVRINATIGPDGIPTQLTVASGDTRLTAAALAAVRQWRYSPAVRDGNPVESQTVITVNFKIN